MKAFLRYYVELPFPVGEVDRIITQLPAEWLDLAARDANIRAALLLSVPEGTDPEVGGKVCVSLSPPSLTDGVLSRSMQWLAAGHGEPLLHGELELAELGPSRTQLALTAQHRPLAPVPLAANRARSQRIAESTLKAFIDQLASYIGDMLSSQNRTIPLRQPAVVDPSAVAGHGWMAAR